MTQTVLLKSTLLLVIAVTAINQNLWFRFKSKTPFDQLLNITNLYLGVHALFVFIIEHFFLPYPLYDRLAPFSLMYGPFLYFALFIIHHRNIEFWKILLHSSPFAVFNLGYILLIIFGLPEDMVEYYGKCLGLASVLSFTSYSIWAIVYNSKPIKQQLKQHKLVVIIAVIILLFTTMIMFVGAFSDEAVDNFTTSVGLLRFLMYGCMFCCSLIIHRFYSLVVSNAAISPVPEADFGLVNNLDGRYEKSVLAEAEFDSYLSKLEKLMNTEQIYLHRDLSLLKLAQLTRIPKHHISQVLNLKLKMNFYEYVNGLRVQHACILLKENSFDTLENIAEQSGFNSKVSFNRHFKSIKGVTPSAYRVTNTI